MKKTYMTSVEVEMEMKEAREAKGLVEDMEKMLISNMVENARLNNMIGDKLLMVIDPAYVHIPTWQRRVNLSRVAEISNNYNKYKWEVPKVVYADGILVCIDGQHRLYGAFKGKASGVVVEILECSIDEAIDLFINQSKDRTKMSPADIYKASVAAGDDRSIMLREVCHKNGVNIKGDDCNLENPVGILTSVSDGLRYPIETIDRILNLIGRLEWNGNGNYSNGKAYQSKFIRSFRKLYAYNVGNEEMMERILIANCRGSVWFKENLEGLSQYHVFDVLSRVLSGRTAKGFRSTKSAS